MQQHQYFNLHHVTIDVTVSTFSIVNCNRVLHKVCDDQRKSLIFD